MTGICGRSRRPAAYGLVAAAGAMAVAVGPLLGGAVSTFASWRYVFFGEVVIVARQARRRPSSVRIS